MKELNLEYKPWSFSTTSRDLQAQKLSQIVFFQGNGVMGSRAVMFPDILENGNHGLFLNGGFDWISHDMTNLVNFPDPFGLGVLVDGTPVVCSEMSDFKQEMNLRNGEIHRTFCVDSLQFDMRRFFSHSDCEECYFKISVKNIGKTESNVALRFFIDTNVRSESIDDDQTVTEREIQNLFSWSGETDSRVSVSSVSGRIKLFYQIQSDGKKQAVLKPCETMAAQEKIIISSKGFREPGRFDYEKALACSSSIWDDLWKACDVETDLGTRLQCAARYNILQLIQNTSLNDPSTFVGARGISHGRYKGCYFWDTEIFILPFFSCCLPMTARNLLEYRYSTLNQARKNAVDLNLKGARFPWMSSITGKDQCLSWDIGKSEIHVTSDVVYAMLEYMVMNNDESFDPIIAEVAYDAARYWLSRFTLQSDGSFWLINVKGPDEYGGVGCNNAYSVYMALVNIQIAVDCWQRNIITGNYPDVNEIHEWQYLMKNARIPYDDEKSLVLEDETYMHLEEAPWLLEGKDQNPSYKSVCYDRLQRYKVLKQADLVLLDILVPDLFTRKEKIAIWNEYEKRTLHDSSLSWSVHAYDGLRLGFDDKAMDYLEKSLMLDMENLMGNTAEEGLHVGGMGMAWQAVSYLVSRRQSTEFRIKLQTFENYLSKLTIKLKDEKD
ncbi:MAG: hypothetical protein PHO44_07270 [Sphaerochaetaceae bacterium]|nr:hypothetical protein [Sphaerochaetaceae bacterium]MDD4007765.1 hypothetical protein [Sphaerochaetaceae bacterium]MDD4396828.1 hypothetical protein [Sphaerochaetaceae bacterium]